MLLNTGLKIILLCIALCLVGCNQAHSAKNEIKVGTISGPETELMEVAKEVAKDEYGLKVKIVEFSDYSMPNTALNDGSIDANMFQHQAYLDQTIQNRHYDLVAIGKVFIYPMGIYSKHYPSLLQLPTTGASVAIPNDPAMKLVHYCYLEKAGLISLDHKAGNDVSLRDVIGNQNNLKFTPLDAAQLTRALSDVDLAAINTNYAIPAGLTPSKDALFLEDANSPYANVLVVRAKDKDDPKFAKLLLALQSKQVVKKAKKLFHDQAIPAWQTSSQK